MTVRSEGQFNTVVYDEEDIYRNQERRDVILLNADDMKQLGLEPDQRLRIKSEVGEMRYILARPFDIRSASRSWSSSSTTMGSVPPSIPLKVNVLVTAPPVSMASGP